MRSLKILCALTVLLLAFSCSRVPGNSNEPPTVGEDYTAFKNPQRVTIRGFNEDAMEPFLTRDGRFLFFNNSNDPSVNTNLHYAELVDSLTFDYRGEVGGVNSDALEGVPTLDAAGTFYFVSSRSYDTTLSSIYSGSFANGAVSSIALVPGVSRQELPYINFDVEVSPDGNSLYFADGLFSGEAVPDAADLVAAERDGAGFRRLANTNTIFANINTNALEYAACISADELELFFTRFDGEEIAIYRSVRESRDAAFSLPGRVSNITGFVEAATLSPDERALYYHRRDGNRFFIYRVSR